MYKNLRRVRELYKNSRGALITSQIFLLMSVILNLIIVSLNGRLVNDGVQQGNIDVVVNVAIWMLGLTLLQTVFTVGNALYAVLFAEGTANYLRTATFRNIQSLSFGNLDRYRTSDLLVRLTSDVNNIKFAVLYGMMLLLQAPFTIVLTVLFTLLLVPSLVWLMFIGMTVVGIVLVFLMRGLTPLYQVRQQRLDGVNNVLQEGLAGVRVVKAFNREHYETQRFEHAAANLRTAALAPAYRLALFLPALMSLVYCFAAVMLSIGGQQVFAGVTSLGDIVVFSSLLMTAIVPMALLAYIMPFFEAGEASAQRIIQVLEEQAEVQDQPNVKPIDVSKVRGRIVFENASFGYRDENGVPQGRALQNINLTVEPGQTIGFLGATGSGKSTLVNLIPRFYDVCAGRVTIDGIDVREIPLKQMRHIVAPALQDAVLFSGTVRGNILFGQPNVDEDEMLAASHAADADSFVSNIPEAYDAPVVRRGANFSGGQRQRLSIARALAGTPKILILDDSTSALDLATEARVQNAVQALMSQTTKLYVAQRISAVMTADQIVLLDGGKQVALGTHEELLARSPLYRDIYESQLGKIQDGANGGAQ
jgi:ABC-type multidrug transport system fused ATPase/permease subunit